jgi:hypothetical protein
MGTDSFWRATLSRLPFVLIATVLAGSRHCPSTLHRLRLWEPLCSC